MHRIAVSLLLAAACAGTQEPRGAAPGVTAAETGDDSDEQVCREEHVTGSLRPRTVCRSKMEMRKDQHDAQEFSNRGNRWMQTKQGN
jgi:hypothetical protein